MADGDGGEPQLRLADLGERVESIEGLDDAAQWLGEQVRQLIPSGPIKDALSGTWLGHPLHPVLTDVPIGAWSAAIIVDVVGGRAGRKAAQRLVATGILAAVPTAVSGASDFGDIHGRVARVGLVHALANSGALVLFSSSWLQRRRGHHFRGRLLGMAGLASMVAGGYLGGHLSYARGVGINTTAFESGPSDWTAVCADDELGTEPKAVSAADMEVLVVRQDGKVYALANRCTHRGGPLAEGQLAEGCVTCPWHGSTFRLEDGEVITGPAAVRQPAFAARVSDGQIEVRRVAH